VFRSDRSSGSVDYMFLVLQNCDNVEPGLMFIHVAGGLTCPAKAVGVYIAVCMILRSFVTVAGSLHFRYVTRSPLC
jgi:hypothetical protein